MITKKTTKINTATTIRRIKKKMIVTRRKIPKRKL